MFRCFCILSIAWAVLSQTWSLPHPLQSISSQNVHLVQSLSPVDAYICSGALQVDLRDSSRFLVGVCTSVAVNKSGSLATFAVNLQSQISVIVGDASASTPAPGDWDGLIVKMPQYFHQTRDKKKLLFVDDNSCVRELDRNTRRIVTVIGKSKCGSQTLDISTAITSGKFVYGMAYEESSSRYYFSVANHGVYVYKKAGGGNYVGKLIIAENDQSSSITVATRQTYIHGGFLWQKVRSGLNRYKLNGLDLTQLNRYDNSIFVRFLSSPGPWGTIDPTAKYQPRNFKLGVTDADLSMSPGGKTLMIADLIEDRLFFLDTSNGDLSVLCKRGRTAPVDGNERNCTFVDIKAAVWSNEYKILVYEASTNVFRTILFMIPTTTSTSTTQAPTKLSTSPLQVSTTTMSPQGRAESKRPNEGVIIAVSVSVGMLALTGIVLAFYLGITYWRKSSRVTKVSSVSKQEAKEMKSEKGEKRPKKTNAAVEKKPVVKKPGGRNFTANHHH